MHSFTMPYYLRVSEELCAVPNDNSESYVCKALYLALTEDKWSKR